MFKISKAMIAHFISAPIVLGITAGSAWVVRHFPGIPPVSPSYAAAVGSGIGLAAAGYALHYLKGLREWERLEGEGVIVVDEETERPLTREEIPPTTAKGADETLTALPEATAPPASEGGAPGGGE